MFIIIRDNTETLSYILNEENTITYKGLFIYSRNGNYYISLKDGYYFCDDGKIRKLELKKYEIVCEEYFYNIELYVYDNDDGYDSYDFFENRNFILAYSNNADITCYDPYLKDHYLICRDGYLESSFDVRVNGKKYVSQHIKQEDVIEFIGIRIIYYDDFLYINSFNCAVNLEKYQLNAGIVRYRAEYHEPYYYLPEKTDELKIDELKKFGYKSDIRNKDFIRNIMPSIIMALSMSAIALINFYSSQFTSQNRAMRVIYLIMPVSMILSNIFIPVLFHLVERKKERKNYLVKKNEYLKYLDNYYQKLQYIIDEYRRSLNSSYFDLLEAKEKMFYANERSTDYLTLSLGKTIIDHRFDFEKTDDEQIDEKLKKIRHYLSYIDDIPLFLDLRSYRRVSIISKPGEINYYFNKILMELAFKHHFDDIVIGLYVKDVMLHEEIYNLPHLFMNGKRLLFSSLKQLQDLDRLKLERPLLLLIDRYCEYQFSNPDIYVIYFAGNIRNTYKNSEAIIEYLGNNCYLHHEDTIRFSYYQKEMDFNTYYSYLGRFHRLERKKHHGFFEVFSNFSIRESYLKRHNDLKANFAFTDEELLDFDLHESKQGPHGLIGGSTGSGKSELIISLLLSMCIRYSPAYLNIILIDYKGGGIRESLSYNGEAIPHIIASVSNLENNALERLIISLKNECQRRQILFRKMSGILNSSISNLDDYLSNHQECHELELLSHLLIVVDEFAQLKKEHPEQIKELISISRIGRSLGLHLILATQRPSGNIDDEIWSNSRFKISLKVFEEKDSLDIIKTRDAAYIENPGEFIMRIDDELVKARSIYAKDDVNGNEPYEIGIMNEGLRVIKRKRINVSEQLYAAQYYCQKIIDTVRNMGIEETKMDFLPMEPMKRMLYKDQIMFGMKDDYINDVKDPLVYPIRDNLLICSTRKNEINAILNCLDENERKHIVISDHRYEGKYLSDCIDYMESDDLVFLFRILQEEKHDVSIVIEDLNMFLSYNEEMVDILCGLLRRSGNSGCNYICLSQNAQLSYRLINLFRNKLMIDINERSDLNVLFSSGSIYKGKSFYYDEQIISFIPILTEGYVKCGSSIDKLMRYIPDSISPLIENDRFLVGYDVMNRKEVFSDSDLTVVSYDEDLLKPYKDIYGLNTVLYDHRSAIRIKDDYLWLGSGIFTQRLFAVNTTKDLLGNEGILFGNGKRVMIRSIDYAQCNDTV